MCSRILLQEDTALTIDKETAHGSTKIARTKNAAVPASDAPATVAARIAGATERVSWPCSWDCAETDSHSPNDF
ncbi:hypothetical protein AVEN_266822-1 [Araneus ventricosus]|uniref:Uncharacterized protein n=1 Tax=Araneus ventricosus TaxID=182803 RepID=A0A4Y2VRD4_ARAVE|nr:hypothetical protein AVEN_266822-1 [Araneus ventricosus]